MGIAVVLILYAVVLSVLAAIASMILGFGVRLYLRRIMRPKRLLITIGFALPFICVLFAGVWFVTYFAINDLVFHHDPMIGDGWYTNIGNGYAIDMIDVTDQGILHPTTGPENGLNSASAIHGVRRLQVSSPYLFGTQDGHAFEHLAQQSNEEDLFFVIDTRTRKQTGFTNESELRAYVSALGATLNLRPIATVYDDYRFRLFDYFAFAALLLISPAALLALLRAAYRLKHTWTETSAASTLDAA